MSAAYWACAQLETGRLAVALHHLKLNGFATYTPHILQRRTMPARRLEIAAPLFPGYTFVAIELQWHAARWCPGIVRIILDGERPAKVPDKVIADLRKREHNGFVVLPKARGLERCDQVRIKVGPFADHLALFEGMKGSERVIVLLALLGGVQRVELPKGDIRPVVA
jgi:transcriptional antiterminator RfaH